MPAPAEPKLYRLTLAFTLARDPGFASTLERIGISSRPYPGVLSAYDLARRLQMNPSGVAGATRRSAGPAGRNTATAVIPSWRIHQPCLGETLEFDDRPNRRSSPLFGAEHPRSVTQENQPFPIQNFLIGLTSNFLTDRFGCT